MIVAILFIATVYSFIEMTIALKKSTESYAALNEALRKHSSEVLDDIERMRQLRAEPVKEYPVATSDLINIYVKASSIDELDAKRKIIYKVLFSDIKDKCETKGDSIIFKY